jgi:hypothetical protein
MLAVGSIAAWHESGSGTEYMTTKYAVVEHRSGRILAVYATIKRARRAADRLDLAYGAIGYRVQPVNLQPEKLTAGKDVDSL